MRTTITSVSDPDDIPFTPIGEGFLKKHGRSRCPCCRDEGVERIIEIGPAVRGATRKKAAVCRDHEEEGREIFKRICREFEPDYSEAAWSMRY
jgi:hypothetical protein